VSSCPRRECSTWRLCRFAGRSAGPDGELKPGYHSGVSAGRAQTGDWRWRGESDRAIDRVKAAFHGAAIIAGIASRRFALTGPWFVTFKLTRACNLTCAFCRYRGGAGDEGGSMPASRGAVHLDRDLALRTLEELPELGTQRVSFQGDGEPLLYPHLFEVLGEARRLGLVCELITNGVMITDDVASRLVELEIDEVCVSITSATQESYTALHGGNGGRHWPGVREGVRRLVRRRGGASRPKVLLVYVLARPNWREVPEMIAQADELGADGVAFAPMAVYSDEMRALAVTAEEERAALEALRAGISGLGGDRAIEIVGDPLLRYGGGEGIASRIRCSIGWLTAGVRPAGEVVPCLRSDWIAGNLHDQSFREIWRGPAFQEFRRRSIRIGGGTDPALKSRCSYCCFYPMLRRANHAVSLASFFTWA